MRNLGLGSWPYRRRVKSAERVALIADDVAVTYGELSERVDRLANALRGRGVKPGDRVAYLGDNHPSFVEVLFATGAAGAIFVPINTRLAAPEVAHILRDSSADVLFHSEQLRDLVEAAAADLSLRLRVMVPERAGSGSTADDSPEDYELFLSSGDNEHPDLAVTEEDPAVIMYTSGTTGLPKGAVLSHRNLTWNCINVLVDYDIVSDDVALLISPLFHAASLGMGLLPVFLKGGTSIIPARFVPGEALRLVERYRVTYMSGVPTTYQLLCEHENWSSTDLGSLRKLTCGGSPVPARVREAFEERGLRFTGGYGMTEASPGTTSLPPHKSRDKAGSAGLPHFFTSVRVVGGSGEDVGAGEVGEILVKGPHVTPGYWNRSDSNGEFVDGWFRSGDLGRLDEEGYLYIADRLKDMIISGGENIYPAEVEQVILELPGVTGVAVVGIPDEKWGEVPRAILTVREGYSVSEEDLRAYLEPRLARFKIPRSIRVVRELPRTASGKVQKAKLREEHGQ